MQNISLPEVVRTGGMPLMEAISLRRSGRDIDPSKDIDLQTLSNLLWAAFGINRTKGRTAPSSHNRQEIELYVCLKSGVYRYNPVENLLEILFEKDMRAETGSQPFVGEAPVEIALVSDTTKITGKTPQGVIESTYADTGFICQNIYLFCASEGLSTVARALVPKEELAAKWNLHPGQIITLVQTVGYPLPRG
ncbi:MAG: SagB/ThcOx family dehydrogenase [Bacteroidales bacterium]|nr:SagB/ThcOx family dehydrogenase [Candidatus Equibacterium intestinale]